MHSALTANPVTAFKRRSGRTFRAKLKLEQAEDGKWRVEFNEDWAKEPPRVDDADGAEGAAVSAGQGETGQDDGVASADAGGGTGAGNGDRSMADGPARGGLPARARRRQSASRS